MHLLYYTTYYVYSKIFILYIHSYTYTHNPKPYARCPFQVVGELAATSSGSSLNIEDRCVCVYILLLCIFIPLVLICLCSYIHAIYRYNAHTALPIVCCVYKYPLIYTYNDIYTILYYIYTTYTYRFKALEGNSKVDNELEMLRKSLPSPQQQKGDYNNI